MTSGVKLTKKQEQDIVDCYKKYPTISGCKKHSTHSMKSVIAVLKKRKLLPKKPTYKVRVE